SMQPPSIRLEDERVLLRPLEIGDVKHLLSISENEPENWSFGLESAAGEANLIRYIESALQSAKELHSYPFIIFDKQIGHYAGSTRYYQIQHKHKRLAIGYTWIGNAFKQTGLNAHCKLLLLTHAFESLSMERVEFMADTRNERSINSILALGAKSEGTLRSHALRPDGTRRDTAVLSILKQEWLEQVKPSLIQKISGRNA
ncbi:MAG: GNAT family N-acetyltransferase, partial [Flavobacteriales bacterium]